MPIRFMNWRGRWRAAERRLLPAGACSVCSTEQWAWMIVCWPQCLDKSAYPAVGFALAGTTTAQGTPGRKGVIDGFSAPTTVAPVRGTDFKGLAAPIRSRIYRCDSGTRQKLTGTGKPSSYRRCKMRFAGTNPFPSSPADQPYY